MYDTDALSSYVCQFLRFHFVLHCYTKTTELN